MPEVTLVLNESRRLTQEIITKHQIHRKSRQNVHIRKMCLLVRTKPPRHILDHTACSCRRPVRETQGNSVSLFVVDLKAIRHRKIRRHHRHVRPRVRYSIHTYAIGHAVDILLGAQEVYAVDAIADAHLAAYSMGELCESLACAQEGAAKNDIVDTLVEDKESQVVLCRFTSEREW